MHKYLIALPTFRGAKGFNHPTILVSAKNKQDAVALARHLRERRHARASRHAVDVHGARPAQRHPAAVLGAGEIEPVTQHPQERRIGRSVGLKRRAVDGESGHREVPGVRSSGLRNAAVEMCRADCSLHHTAGIILHCRCSSG